MYKRLRAKIVSAMMLSLVMLFAGTLAVILLSSYHDTLRADREMMQRYAKAYWENGNPKGVSLLPPGLPRGEGKPSQRDKLPSSQFYSVELSEDDETASVNNDPGRSGLSDREMTELARRLTQSSKRDGVYEAWVYHVEEKEGRMLVVLLDNTLVDDSLWALLKNALRYGLVMVLLLLLLSLYLAERMVRPLEEMDEQEKQFIANASHELKTPVAVIHASIALLRREVGENRWLANIETENRRMGSLVQQMLELSRLVKPQVLSKAVNLSRLLQKEILTFEGIAYEKGQVLKAEVGEEIIVNGNEEQMGSLLSILLDNAIEYARKEEPILILLRKEKDHILLRISNACSPLSQDQKARLFDRFYRAEESHTGEGGHYGLGLSIARRIVEVHRGEIRIEGKDESFVIEISFPAA